MSLVVHFIGRNHSKSLYSVNLDGGWFSYYGSGTIDADNVTYTKSYGTVSKKDYTLSLSKESKTGYRIKGSGTINQ